MTRRLRIDDLTSLAVPSQPALSPDGARVVYVLRTLDARRRTATSTSSGPCRPPAARRAGSPPAAATPRPPGRRTARGSRSCATASCTCSPPTAASPSRSPTCRSAPAPRCGARTATGSPSPPRSTRPTARGPLVTAGRRLPGRRRRHVRRGPQPAARARPRRPATAARSPTATTPASRPGRPTARTVAFTRKVGADSDLTFRTAVHLLDVDRPQGRAARRRLRGRHRRHGLVRRRRPEPAGRRAPGPEPRARPPACGVPLDGGEPVDLTGHLDRNVMPGGPAYPGARPVETADGRLLFASATAAAPTSWDRATARSSPARAASSPGSRSPAAPPSSRSPPPRRTARSSRSTSRPAPRPC